MIEQILQKKIEVIQKYINLRREYNIAEKQEFVWTEEEIADWPFRKPILKFLSENKVNFELTRDGFALK